MQFHLLNMPTANPWALFPRSLSPKAPLPTERCHSSPSTLTYVSSVDGFYRMTEKTEAGRDLWGSLD